MCQKHGKKTDEKIIFYFQELNLRALFSLAGVTEIVIKLLVCRKCTAEINRLQIFKIWVPPPNSNNPFWWKSPNSKRRTCPARPRSSTSEVWPPTGKTTRRSPTEWEIQKFGFKNLSCWRCYFSAEFSSFYTLRFSAFRFGRIRSIPILMVTLSWPITAKSNLPRLRFSREKKGSSVTTQHIHSLLQVQFILKYLL